jgi:hypothetical protein
MAAWRGVRTERSLNYSLFPRAVMLDSELALRYGVETGQFNRAMKRNVARFPADFAFQLTKAEWDSLRCQIGSLKTAARGQHRKYLPRVFTEHGAIIHATPRGRHVNEGAVEWPPSPWRIVRALVTTWHLKTREVPEATVRSLLAIILDLLGLGLFLPI